MEHYQMTMEELLSDSFLPTKKQERFGVYGYYCPICGDFVGLNKTITEFGNDEPCKHFKEKCKNGHVMNWSQEE